MGPALLVSVSELLVAPHGASAGGFDFDLLELEVTGQNEFFDDFEDGNRFTPPTSLMIDFGDTVTTESDGALKFTDVDGSIDCNAHPVLPDCGEGLPWRNDGVRITNALWANGAGSAEFTATFAPFTPTSEYQAVGIGFGAGSNVSFGIDWHPEQIGFPSPCGTGPEAFFLNPRQFGAVRGPFEGCNSIDPSAIVENVILKAIFDDENNQLLLSYSTDGGATFIALSEFDVPVSAIAFPFGDSFDVFLFAEGVVGTDRDGDGVIDALDNCPDWSNVGQSDIDQNDIGDVCECGDQTGDGTVDVSDILAINAAIFDPSQVTELCDTNDDQLCDVNDILGANAKIFGAEAYCSRYPAPGP
jgi:hypothetical protein